jgi:hypothetical protein
VHRGLGAQGELGDKQCDCGKSAPGTWEVVTVNGGVDGCGFAGGRVWMGKIVRCMVFAWLQGFWDQGQGRRLERAQHGLHLTA